jgi:hypothetical protein
MQHKLRDLHLELSQAHRLDPNDRAMLETVLKDLRELLDQSEEETAVQTGHGDSLEGAAVRLEASHPTLATAIRSVMDALAKAGI